MSSSSVLLLLRRINEASFKRHPLLTNVALSSLLAGTSDYIAQKVVQGHKILDKERTRHVMTYGCTTAPLWHLWYKMIDKYIKRTHTWLKVFLDQTTVTPLDYLGFFAVFNYMKGDTFEECFNELNRVYFKAFIPDTIFWPFATFVGYKYISLRYRFFYFEFLNLLWDTFLCCLKFPSEQENDSSNKHYIKKTQVSSRQQCDLLHTQPDHLNLLSEKQFFKKITDQMAQECDLFHLGNAIDIERENKI
ncbi:PXMP2/4 family protein 4-like [Xenia sp. Carnegie-2017]|uniref:PXMP2/4 family protein 4-like n=1 Tax=Xenia sp. Carnegie-2017 TaxID=2897299 RepID=UPI001F038234|nr:PXMP2/4 family protein 4-like [Xenia sp. Carnegie-2017]